MNVNFFVKLRKHASDTCEMLSEAYGGEVTRKPSVCEWHTWFKQSSYIEIVNEENYNYFLR